jgi:hypothetical protein
VKSYKQKVMEGTANPTRDRAEGKNPVIQKKMEETLEKLEGVDVEKSPKEAYEYAALYKKLQDILRNEPAEEAEGNSVVASLLGRVARNDGS